MTAPRGLARERLENWRIDAQTVRRLLPAGGRVHLVGIGGIGMAGLAHLLQARSMQVTGSDEVEGRTTHWLRAQGIPVHIGHRPEHVPPDVHWVVKTPAVRETNHEILRARSRGIPVFTRGVVLPALLEGTRSIAVSGTHGKTTTSAMVATIFEAAGAAPSFCIGGELDDLGGVARAGRGDVMVVEADESDGTVQCYDPDVAVVTNVEYDHMEHFSHEEDFFDCFREFMKNARRMVVACADDRRSVSMAQAAGGDVRTYGLAPESDVRAEEVRLFPYASSFRLTLEPDRAIPVELPVPGVHNVVNAAGAAAAALVLGVPADAISHGLAGFRPARRRFEVVVPGPPVTVISDYAHHPTEIRAVISAARRLPGRRLIALFQPHRYTRTRALRAEFPPAFEGLDRLILMPVYAASEDPIPGGASEDLLAAIRTAGAPPTSLADALDTGWREVASLLQSGDILLILGAGDIEQLVPRACRTYGRDAEGASGNPS